MAKMRYLQYEPELVRTVFKCLEYLLKGLADREDQFIYLLVMINKEGFITDAYRFYESEDRAYYAHFIKLIVRIITERKPIQALPVKSGSREEAVKSGSREEVGKVRGEMVKVKEKEANLKEKEEANLK